MTNQHILLLYDGYPTGTHQISMQTSFLFISLFFIHLTSRTHAWSPRRFSKQCYC